MKVRREILAELRLRVSLLPDEFKDWVEQAESNAEGMGIHRSQIGMLKDLFQGLWTKQESSLDALARLQDPEEFAKRRSALEYELCATHGVMSIFRLIFSQREDERFFRTSLDAADVVAADGYYSVMDRAVRWKAVPEDRVRVPPLTCLVARYSPAAYTRSHVVSAFGMALEGYRELELPISVISLPFHHTTSLWTYMCVHHEVGHIIDRDLGLREELEERLEGLLAKVAHATDWTRWLREIIADALGVVLGGESFVHGMARILRFPRRRVLRLREDAMHPIPYVRVLLLAEMLRQSGMERFTGEAKVVADAWKAEYGTPAELRAHVDTCPDLIRVVLREPLRALRDHPILALMSKEAGFWRNQDELSRFLRTTYQRPNPKAFPARLVPAAADAAIRAVEEDHGTKLREIHERALDFLGAVRRGLPTYLSGETASRRTYWREVIENLELAPGSPGRPD